MLKFSPWEIFMRKSRISTATFNMDSTATLGGGDFSAATQHELNSNSGVLRGNLDVESLNSNLENRAPGSLPAVSTLTGETSANLPNEAKCGGAGSSRGLESHGFENVTVWNPLVFHSLRSSATPAPAPGSKEQAARWVSAKVSTMVASQTRQRPFFHGKRVIPSGRLPFPRLIPD